MINYSDICLYYVENVIYAVHIRNAVRLYNSRQGLQTQIERGENGINKSNMNSNCINYSAFNNFCSAFSLLFLNYT
jgi:hypothetical protein